MEQRANFVDGNRVAALRQLFNCSLSSIIAITL
jgi:hypothetical protein